MRPTFTIVENTGDPSQLTPMEIALSRCSWAPSDSPAETGGTEDAHVAAEIDHGVDKLVTDAIGRLGEELKPMHRETRDLLLKLLALHAAPRSVAPPGAAEPDDCAMEFVDSMPSEDGLLVCFLLKQPPQWLESVEAGSWPASSPEH
jgi:hypothetical protein